MNKNQKFLLGIAGLVIVLMCLFPPWTITESIDLSRAGYSDGRGHAAIVNITGKIRYASVFRPPREPAHQSPEREQATAFLATHGFLQHKSLISYPRLLIQIAVVLAVSGVLLFLVRTRTGHAIATGKE